MTAPSWISIKSIKLDPAYAKPFNNRGAAYLRKGEYDLAIESFDEAIKLKSNYGGAFANRAGAYLKKNEYDRAARDYDEAVRLEPNRRLGVERTLLDPSRSRFVAGGAGGLQQGAAVSGRTTPPRMTRVGLIHLKMGSIRRGDR